MTLFLPIGPPGSGKSTLVRSYTESGKLAADAIVCPDEYRVVLTGSKVDQSANHRVFEIVNRIVEERLSRGLDVWLDATNLAPGPRQGQMLVATRYRQPITCIVFDVPMVELRRRNLTRTDPVPFDVLERMVAQQAAALADVRQWSHMAERFAAVTVVSAAELEETT